MHAPLEAMNGRARRPAAARAAAPRDEKAMEKEQRRPPSSKTAPVSMKTSPANATPQGMKNRKIALQQDVDKLRKKLRHEENVHRALERAFTRPLGALPRLPPFLPSQTLELLAEVAVLEEEVVRLEEQVVNFRQELYREAVITTSMAAKSVYFPDGYRSTPTPARHKPPAQPQSPELSTSTRQGSDQDAADWPPSLRRSTNAMRTPRRPGRSLSQGDCPGKENQSFGSGTNSCREFGLAPLSNVPGCRVQVGAETRAGFQTTSAVDDLKAVEGSNGTGPGKASTAANEVSEELLACLLAIFSQKSASSGQDEERVSPPSVSGSCGSSSADPYGVPEFGWRDIRRNKQLRLVNTNISAGDDSALGQRLKALLQKLSLVDLAGLSHQHNRLAFWINTYYSCMMNAFLEQGAPSDPRMLVAMMPKATINVGGRVLSAVAIEHFILRLPHYDDDAKARKVAGLAGWPHHSSPPCRRLSSTEDARAPSYI